MWRLVKYVFTSEFWQPNEKSFTYSVSKTTLNWHAITLDSLTPAVACLQHSVKYAVCVVRWQVPLCWRWCMHCGHKGGLLQLNSLGYFRTTVTTAAICLQRRRSSRVPRKEVRTRNSTPPWTTLAESSWENSVPDMCSRVSLPYRHGAVIPR